MPSIRDIVRQELWDQRKEDFAKELLHVEAFGCKQFLIDSIQLTRGFPNIFEITWEFNKIRYLR